MNRDRQLAKNHDYFLWERFKSGDREALSKIFYANYQLLYNYGLRLYDEPAFIKDCIQELFSELISKISTLGPTDNIRFYLLASFRRKVFEKLKGDRTLNFSDKQETPSQTETEHSPEARWIIREQEKGNAQKINRLVNNLHAREREAIYLKFYNNLSYEEITQIMGINYQSARKLVYRALRSLREMSKDVFEDI